MITLYFVRHGQTVWNESGRYQGSTEVALSALGKEQAKLTAHWFEGISLNGIISSSLGRAMETAKEIAKLKSMNVEVIDALQELHFGDWEGKTFEEIEHCWPGMIEENIHENLKQIIEEKKQESPAPVMLDKTEMKDLLEKSGVKEEKLENFEEHFEMAAGEHGKLVASNVSSGKKFEVKTPDVVIKINSDKTDIVSTQVIDGRQCLVIQIDERLAVICHCPCPPFSGVWSSSGGRV